MAHGVVLHIVLDVHMHQHVGYRRMTLENPPAGRLGNAVSLRYADTRIDADMGIDQAAMRHAAGAQLVQDAGYSGGIDNDLADPVDFLDRQSGIDQFSHRVPGKDRPMRTIMKPTITAAIESAKLNPIRLPPIPNATTSEEAASERACQALAMSMGERSRSP